MLLFNNLDKTFQVKRGYLEALKNISLELND